MVTELLHVGFGDYITANRILAVIRPGSTPVRRLLEEAERKGLMLDVTHGRRTKAIVLLDSGHLVLLALQPETIANRLAGLHGKAQHEG
ncbi:MAG: extracellular matrix/biofilm biosynthesis regulator RemA family protein [Anaerolineae bacterium]